MSNDLYASRHLDWEGCYNVRDLGGLPTRDGGVTRWRAVVRADLLGRLTERGRWALRDYGVRTIIDLRAPFEVEREPSPYASPGGDPAAPLYHNLPLEKYLPHVGALIRQAVTRGEVYAIILDHYPDAVAAVMRAIAEAPAGAVVIHCHAGKDRTGLVAALLLGLAGAPAEVIAQDYALSQERLWPLWERMVAEAGGQAAFDSWAKPLALPETMRALLGHLEVRYGGARGYLAAAGLAAAELDALTRRLRG